MAPVFKSVRNLGPAAKPTHKQGHGRISPARLVAFEVLRRVEEAGSYASVLLAQRENDLSARDRSLCHELTMGVLRWQLTLDHYISHYAARDPSKMDVPVLLALRLGLYQLRFLFDLLDCVRPSRLSMRCCGVRYVSRIMILLPPSTILWNDLLSKLRILVG
jgi:hypothetical protein